MSVPASQLPMPKAENEAVKAVLVAISLGQSLRKACKDNGIMAPTFVGWTVQDPDLAERYVRARVSQAAVHADEILEIADNFDEDPKSRSVRIEARKWLCARLHSKGWGDKVEVTGKDGAPLNGPPMDANAVIDGLVALATEHPTTAHPLRKLLQSALDRIPIPE